jgi:hypothetical protein
MTPQEFDHACATHDWTYNYSDDHSMWKLGEQQAQVLQWAMQEDNRLIQLYRLWSAYQFSGPAWNKPVMTREEFELQRQEILEFLTRDTA